ncbi:MAG: glycosyltransferase [Lachnospiraceae bacterium]|nr:glycosyltransferase [Lachnospiraceae bacterium]
MEQGGQIMFYIVVVSYNAGDRLKETLKSILAQTYEHVRVIVRDAASTDGSLTEVMPLIREAGNIRLVSEPDEGIYDAMNRAVQEISPEYAEGTYVLFLNCGDVLSGTDVLSKADKRIRAWNRRYAMRTQLSQERFFADICYGDTFERLSGQVSKANPRIDDFACYRNLPCHQSVFYALPLLREEPFDCRWKVRADYEQFLRLKYKRHAQIAYLKMTVADYEGGGYSESPEGKKQSEQERREIIAMYLPKSKILKYDAYRTATLQPLREKLSKHPKTAAAYQHLKNKLYSKK